MTKMVCINQKPWMNAAKQPCGYPAPKYGEIVTVTGSKYYPQHDVLVLFLAEYAFTTPKGNPVGFGAQNFRKVVDDKIEACDANFLDKIRTREKEDA